MNFKKIVAIISILTIAVMPGIALADMGYEILSPANEAVVMADELGEIEFTSVSGDNVVVFLDDVEIGQLTASGIDKITLDSPLNVGKHKIEIIGYNEITTNKTESIFYVNDDTSDVLTEYDFNGEFPAGYAPAGKDVAGKDANGIDVKVEVEKIEGVDGEGDEALCYIVKRELSEMTLTSGSGKWFVVQGIDADFGDIYTIEYHIKMLDYCRFNIECGNTKLGQAGYIGRGTTLFSGDGGVNAVPKGTFTYPIGEWMHVKHVIDTRTMIEQTIINDNLLASGPTSALADLTHIKMQYFVSNKNANQGIVLDNIKFTRTYVHEGDTEVLYVDGSGEEKTAQDDKISEKTSEIIISGLKFAKNTNALAMVKTKFDGKEILPKSASIEEGKCYIKFDSPIPAQANCEVSITEGDITIFRSFATDFKDFGISSVDFVKGTNKYELKRQLKNGDVLDLDINFYNRTSGEGKGVVVTAVFSGKKLVSLVGKDVSVTDVTDAIEDSVTLPASGDELSVELYLLQDFKDMVALSKVWALR